MTKADWKNFHREMRRAPGRSVNLPGGPGGVVARALADAFACRLGEEFRAARRSIRLVRQLRKNGYAVQLP